MQFKFVLSLVCLCNFMKGDTAKNVIGEGARRMGGRQAGGKKVPIVSSLYEKRSWVVWSWDLQSLVCFFWFVYREFSWLIYIWRPTMAKNDSNNRQSIEGRNLSGNNEIKGSSELIFLDSWSIVFGHNCNVEDSNWTSDKSKFKCRLELFNPQVMDAAKVRRLNSNMSICTVPRNSQNVDGVKINQTNHSKALGLNIDENLSCMHGRSAYTQFRLLLRVEDAVRFT